MADISQIKIVINRDGPYAVHPNLPLDQAVIVPDADGHSAAWAQGKQYPPHNQDKHYMLCRCGHTKTPPYCDGTHDDVGFCGTEHADRRPYVEEAEFQPGPTVGLLDDESLCAGARFCDRGATVWRLAQSADPKDVEQAVQEACDCPSGRLTIADHNRQLLEPKLPPGVSLVEDPVQNCRGPIWVKGGVRIEGQTGEQYEVRNRVTLCRCGESENMPFCDARHYECPHMQGLDE